MIRFPDYDRSILSIAASVLKHYGVADCPHKTLKEFDDILNKNYENVIVMLFDGMGVDAINTHLAEERTLSARFHPYFRQRPRRQQLRFCPAVPPWNTAGSAGICILKNWMKMLLFLKILCKETEKKPPNIMWRKDISLAKASFKE